MHIMCEENINYDAKMMCKHKFVLKSHRTKLNNSLKIV